MLVLLQRLLPLHGVTSKKAAAHARALLWPARSDRVWADIAEFRCDNVASGLEAAKARLEQHGELNEQYRALPVECDDTQKWPYCKLQCKSRMLVVEPSPAANNEDFEDEDFEDEDV